MFGGSTAAQERVAREITSLREEVGQVLREQLAEVREETGELRRDVTGSLQGGLAELRQELRAVREVLQEVRKEATASRIETKNLRLALERHQAVEPRARRTDPESSPTAQEPTMTEPAPEDPQPALAAPASQQPNTTAVSTAVPPDAQPAAAAEPPAAASAPTSAPHDAAPAPDTTPTAPGREEHLARENAAAAVQQVQERAAAGADTAAHTPEQSTADQSDLETKWRKQLFITLTAAARISLAELVCHPHTWEFIAQRAATTAHFRLPASAASDEHGAVDTVVLSGRNLIAILTALHQTYYDASPYDFDLIGDRALALALYQRISSVVNQITPDETGLDTLKLPRTRIVVDDRPFVDGQPDQTT